MDRIYQTRASLCRPWPRVVLISLLLSITCGSSRGQATAEVAGTTAVSATAGTGAKQLGFPATALPENKNKSPHLAIPAVSAAPEVVNRQALEQRAGQNAGKLLLRSVPTAAQVWIDGAYVGNAPMLLMVAPGKYRVEMRGQRSERAARAVDLLPHETREVVLALAVRYPTRASVR